MQPTIGRTVHYSLNEQDVEVIAQRREDHPETHQGNPVSVGQYFPATIVSTFDGNIWTINLKVLLDGTDEHWATSRPEGSEPGTWRWPS